MLIALTKGEETSRRRGWKGKGRGSERIKRRTGEKVDREGHQIEVRKRGGVTMVRLEVVCLSPRCNAFTATAVFRVATRRSEPVIGTSQMQ